MCFSRSRVSVTDGAFLTSPLDCDVQVDSSEVTITNAVAFRELVLSYEVYKDASEGLLRLVFLHVSKLVKEGPKQTENIRILRDLGIVQTYLLILSEQGTPGTVAAEIITILKYILRQSMLDNDARQLGHLLMCTMGVDDGTGTATTAAGTGERTNQRTRARHMVLDLINSLLVSEAEDALGGSNSGGGGASGQKTESALVAKTSSTGNATASSSAGSIADTLTKVLGPCFFLHFIIPETDARTVVLALQIVANLAHIDKANFCSKFNNASGWHLMASDLLYRTHVPEVFVVLCAMLVGTPVAVRGVMQSLTLQCLQENIDHAYTWERGAQGRTAGATQV